jgi:signal transduction histidine kinase
MDRPSTSEPHRPAGARAAFAADDLFATGGEMGRLMATVDWARTPVGPTEQWPQPLRTVLSFVLASQHPFFVWWSRELVQFYNDGYRPILGSTKHPAAMGQRGRECWKEIWSVIEPMIETVFAGGSTYTKDGQLVLERHGFLEECYFNYAYSPIRGESGAVDGVLVACSETTGRVIGERRLQLLGELGLEAAKPKSAGEASRNAAALLAAASADVPFALIYLADASGARLQLAGSVGIAAGHAAAPETIRIGDPRAVWPITAAQDEVELDLNALAASAGSLPGGLWPEPAQRALVLPLARAGELRPYGFLIAGTSPRLALDDRYRAFFRLLAGHVAAAIHNAEVHEEQRRRAQALAEIDRAKTVFFSNVSHELRTPLALMLGPTRDALASPDRALRGADLEMVHRNELRLLKLVNTLLDFARIEAGRAHARYEPTDLAALTCDVASAFRSAIERGAVRYEVDCPEIGELLHVDRSMWEKVVLNLLSNAFKFTFEGQIRIALRDAGDRVALSVADTGVGIAAHEQARVFERFHRIDGVRARTHEGSGIGLALVGDLVRLHGGTIELRSAPGVGSEFIVSIPKGHAHLPAEQVAAGSDPTGPPQHATPYVEEALGWLATPAERDRILEADAGRASVFGDAAGHVLVVDDNADMRAYLTRLLAPRFSVQTAADGEQALAAMRARRPDLVLTDVMMPNLDGPGLIRELRAHAETARVPVIMLSARAGEESQVAGLNAGADDYLQKPFSSAELIARVSRQLELGRLHQLAASERALAEAARAEAERANRAKDEFLAMLGHELRNPLSPIQTALHLMNMRGLRSREQAVIERQVSHLVRLVDDLLDVARITQGKIELRKQPLELATVVVRALEVASPLLDQKQQRLELQVAPEGLLVHADPDRLAQIISNLVTNAAKYSPPGSLIWIDAEQLGSRVRLRVRDQGVGLAADMVESIFDSFVQQRQAIDRSAGGLGLGLAIVRSLVGLHGGSVWAQSEGIGKGSEFVVELPALAASASYPPPPDTPRRDVIRGGSGKRVLIVDDNEDAAEVLGELLAELGFVVAVAHDGPEALATAARFKPQIALLDIGLPVIDGYELGERLRGLADMPADLDLIAITGYGRAADVQRSRAAGFSAHLVKPLDLDALSGLLFKSR